MQKNIEKRKKLEEEEIKLGYAKPKKNYGGFSDDEEEMNGTQKEQAKKVDSKKVTLKREIKKKEEENKDEEEGEEEGEGEVEQEEEDPENEEAEK